MLDEYNFRYIKSNNEIVPLSISEAYILSILVMNKRKVTSKRKLMGLFEDRSKNPDDSLKQIIWKLKDKLKGEIMILPVYRSRLQD